MFYFGPTEVTVLSILASFSSGQVTHAHYIGSNLESFCQVSEKRIPIEILIRITVLLVSYSSSCLEIASYFLILVNIMYKYFVKIC